MKKRRQRLKKMSIDNDSGCEESATCPTPKVFRYGTGADTNKDVPLRDKDKKIKELQLEIAELRQSN